MEKQSLLRWFSASIQSSLVGHVRRIRYHFSSFLLVFVLSSVIGAAGQAQMPTRAFPAKPTAHRILVKVRPALAQQIEAALPAQGPTQTMALQPGQAGDVRVQSFLGRYSPQSLTPLYPNIIRLRQEHGWSDEQVANQIRQQFARRASRQAAPIATPEISRTYVLDFGNASPAALAAALERLKSDPDVEFAEPDHVVTTNQLPNDPFLNPAIPGSWGQSYQDLWGHYKINAPTAWNTVQGDGVIVAVVDTGIDNTHPDIAANTILGLDFIGPSCQSPVQGTNPIDHFGHGTHVAGTIAAVGNNGIGIIGIAWHAQVMAIKGLDDSGCGLDSTLAPAIQYAANNGADIINASWGGQGTSQTIEQAVQFAYGLGVVFVAAAGNSSEDALNFFPANSPESITVAASDPNDQLASFSDFGSKIDVAAPGVDILSLQASGTQLGPPPTPGTTGYVRLNGTSMATPHVAGTAALILSQNPGYTVEQVRQVIRSSADGSGYNLNFGYGRLNAATALTVTFPLEAKIQGLQFGALPLSPITVQGIARGAGFASYVLEYGTGTTPTSWTNFLTSASPASGTLGVLDPSTLSSGTYTIRLTAFNSSGGAFVDRMQLALTLATITNPAPPLRAPTSVTTFKPGLLIPVDGTADMPSFQNFVVQWASGVPGTVWQTTGITLAGGGLTPVANGLLATWDTSSITQAGYFTIRLIVNGASSGQATTAVYLEPDLLSVGWPVFLNQGPYFSAGVVPAMNADGTQRLVMASPDVGPNPPLFWTFTPDGTAQKIPMQNFGSDTQPPVANLDGIAGDEAVVADSTVVHVFHPDNSFVTFQSSPTSFFVNAPQLIEDLAGDGHLETVAVGSDFANDQLAYVFAWRPDGNQLNGNFPIAIKDQNSLNSWLNHVRILAGDFQGDGNQEIIVQEGLTSNTYTLRMFAHDGTPLTWQVPVLTGIPFAMAGADLDHNGKLETIVFNNNGAQVAGQGAIHVFQPDGTERAGWPVSVPTPNQFAEAFLAVGDFKRDGHEEIVFSHETSLFLFNSDGTLFSNAWPLTTGTLGYGSVVIGDIDGDGFPEIVITRDDAVANTYFDAKLLAIRSNGTIAKTWQLTGSHGFDQYAYPQPIIGDFNNDGITDIAVSYEVTGPGNEVPGVVTIVTTGAPFNSAGNDWPMSLQNARNTDVLVRNAASSLGVALTAGANPSTFGNTLTFTASVTPNVAIGNVVFLDGGNAISGSVALQNGSATLTIGSLGAGAHSITAHYAGGGGFAASTSLALIQNVTPATLTVTANNASRAFGAANPAFSGTITGAVNGDTFTETFSTTATPGSPVGSYAIVPGATGADLGNYTVSPVNGTLTVTPATLTVTANNASRAFGAANPAFSGTIAGALNGDTFTETFSTTATPGSPVGSYAIVPGATGADLGNYTVSPVNGTLAVTPATLTVTADNASRAFGAANPAFSGTITGAVNGDTFTETFSTTATLGSPVGSYAIVPGATGADLGNYTVSPVNGTLTVTPVTLTVTANNASRAFGAANPAFSGTITGALNGDTFTETFSTTATPGSPVGGYAIVPGATGADLGNYTVSPVNGTLMVVKAGSAATLVSSNASVNAGSPVTFTATVASATTGTPTGPVQFFDGATVLGAAPLNAQGMAALTAGALSAGTHAITAQYGGDGNFNGTNSAALAQNVMDFTVAASPANATIKAGGSATFTFTVTPLGGFNQAVSFSCTGLPAESQCSFAPSSPTPNGGPVTSTLTITTTAPSVSRLAPSGRRNGLPVYASLFAGIAGLLWTTLGRKKRRAGSASLLLGIMALGAMAALSGCGGGGTPMRQDPGTPPGTSIVSVTSTAGTSSHAASITLTVTQ
jgi:subtilisin family serine protease